MILFENPDYEKFFNPLCCKNKKIYYEFKKYDGPIPTIRELDAEFQKLVKEKNQIYSEFKIARTEMMELLSAKQNVEHFLGEQNRLEQDIQKKKGDTSL